jgi:hypothetical protein
MKCRISITKQARCARNALAPLANQLGESRMRQIAGAVFALSVAATTAAFGTTYSKNNGIISYTANASSVPMISTLSVLGTLLLPYDNVGAGFQMTGRSAAGNAYNPTQAGDCTQTPSQVLAIDPNWGGNPIGLPAANGLLFTVTPRNYNEPSSCLGVGALLPYTFEFGATLGDAVHLPKEGMLLEMALTRQSGSQAIDKDISEFPVMFLLTQVLPYAYWSTDGATFQALNVNGTNDMRSWPYGVNHIQNGKSVMICTPSQTACVALYSNKTTFLGLSHRQGASNELSDMYMTADMTGSVSDFQRHIARKVLAVGTPSTVSAVISQAKSVISNWGDL